MHIDKLTHSAHKLPNQTDGNDILTFLLKEAKRLHRAAHSDSLTKSLPILRRLIITNTLTGLSLPELKRQRTIIQRKHVLHMLAKENDFKNWAEYKHTIEEGEGCEPSELILRHVGYPNLWFSNYKEAKSYAQQNGGQIIKFGTQAVVIPHQL